MAIAGCGIRGKQAEAIFSTFILGIILSFSCFVANFFTFWTKGALFSCDAKNWSQDHAPSILGKQFTTDWAICIQAH